jgi:hypothetical protein
MNFHVNPQQGHGNFLMSLDLVTKASRHFRLGMAKAGLPDDSTHHLHIHPDLFSEKNIDPRTPPHLYGRP